MKIFKRCLVCVITIITCFFYIRFISSLPNSFDSSKVKKVQGIVTEYNELPSAKVFKVSYDNISYQFSVDSSYKISGIDKNKPIALYMYNNEVGLSENMLINTMYNLPVLYCGSILIICTGFIIIVILEGAFKNE